MADYRWECELESFLFPNSCCRIVDHYRRQGRNKEVPACGFNASASADSAPDRLQQAVAQDMHASWYARYNEARDSNEQGLAAAVREFAARLHAGEKNSEISRSLRVCLTPVAAIENSPKCWGHRRTKSIRGSSDA